MDALMAEKVIGIFYEAIGVDPEYPFLAWWHKK